MCIYVCICIILYVSICENVYIYNYIYTACVHTLNTLFTIRSVSTRLSVHVLRANLKIIRFRIYVFITLHEHTFVRIHIPDNTAELIFEYKIYT